MSWLNLNQSLNSLKGQITNFASEVLSEGVSPASGDEAATTDSSSKNLEEICEKQELEVSFLNMYKILVIYGFDRCLKGYVMRFLYLTIVIWFAYRPRKPSSPFYLLKDFYNRRFLRYQVKMDFKVIF